ncbi:MAG: hypothetical protein LBH94_01755 [Deltaproteobacteria bacterium]|jgi:hypothetical protein|nr:hypothetical protein [Deltaproteobacteria bacterium]
MSKPLITAHDVREARKAGRTEIAVPLGAIVTPQAKDDARDYGIRLVAETSRPGAQACVASPAPAALPQLVVADGAVPGRMTLYAGKAFEEARSG